VSADNQPEAPFLAPQRAGDCVLPLTQEACSQLITLHWPMVKAACQRVLGDAALAEDAAQEVFLLLVRKLSSLPPGAILGGWLYVTAGHVARTHQRSHARRLRRENQPEVLESLMNPSQDSLWHELEPLLDDAMLTLPERQRQLVLSRYFQNNSQRAAASLLGLSESVASRELAAAIESLRRFFGRHGVTVSGAVLLTLLTTRAAHAALASASVVATISSASTLAETLTTAGPLLLGLMKTSTTAKIIVAVAAALITTSATLYYLAQKNSPSAGPNAGARPAPGATSLVASQSAPAVDTNPATPSLRTPNSTALAAASKAPPLYDEAALRIAREKEQKFWQRIDQLALMGDSKKVQELLLSEYGIHLSADEVRQLQEKGQKAFRFGVVELWASRQPQEALAWAASALAEPHSGGGDFHQLFLDAARTSLPNLNRDTLAGMLPDGLGKDKLLDLAEAATDPLALASRILAVTDPAERASRLTVLAQAWSDSQTAVEWARQNLNGADKTAFYAQAGYNLAHQNPQAALQVLGELQGTDAYASTFEAMMRGMVQEGGLGQQAAQLIANSNLDPKDRADLISELARRWVQQDTDAAIAWANTLIAPEDIRAAIPLLVSQLDNNQISRTVESYLKNRDPVMEQGLIEAAAPPGLYFDPEKSRLILDPIIAQDPDLKLTAAQASGSTRDETLWNSVNQTAKRQAEVGQPAAAMEWLAKLPFATQSDYAQAVANVLTVWNLKSPTDAAHWVQNSSLDSTLKSSLLTPAQH